MIAIEMDHMKCKPAVHESPDGKRICYEMQREEKTNGKSKTATENIKMHEN